LAIERYYAIIGCDPQSGHPLPGKLMELDLGMGRRFCAPPEARCGMGLTGHGP
jgi:hypothetical protein